MVQKCARNSFDKNTIFHQMYFDFKPTPFLNISLHRFKSVFLDTSQMMEPKLARNVESADSAMKLRMTLALSVARINLRRQKTAPTAAIAVSTSYKLFQNLT